MRESLFAVLLLILHVNNSMLIPQVAEFDQYANGKAIDDINSTIEFIQQHLLDIPDNSPEDEDDDCGQHINSISSGCEVYELSFQQMRFRHLDRETLKQLSHSNKEKLLIGNIEITLPPPKS